MIDPFIKSTETHEVRSLKAMRKTAGVILAFQLVFLLIYMLRSWPMDNIMSIGLPLLILIYALAFTGLMLNIMIKPIGQLNYRATEVKLILTIILFCIPAIGLLYLLLTTPTFS